MDHEYAKFLDDKSTQENEPLEKRIYHSVLEDITFYNIIFSPTDATYLRLLIKDVLNKEGKKMFKKIDNYDRELKHKVLIRFYKERYGIDYASVWKEACKGSENDFALTNNKFKIAMSKVAESIKNKNEEENIL